MFDLGVLIVCDVSISKLSRQLITLKAQTQFCPFLVLLEKKGQTLIQFMILRVGPANTFGYRFLST